MTKEKYVAWISSLRDEENEGELEEEVETDPENIKIMKRYKKRVKPFKIKFFESGQEIPNKEDYSLFVFEEGPGINSIIPKGLEGLLSAAGDLRNSLNGSEPGKIIILSELANIYHYEIEEAGFNSYTKSEKNPIPSKNDFANLIYCVPIWKRKWIRAYQKTRRVLRRLKSVWHSIGD